MKIKNILSIAALATALVPLAPVYATPLPGICDVLGNAPIGADPVSIASSGVESGRNSQASFAPEIQSKVNAVGATLTVASLSGSQSVNGITVEVAPVAAQAMFDVISSTAGTDSPSTVSLTTALGGGDAAQQLAKSMQGLRRGNGSIDPVVLTSAVSSYNSYVKDSIERSQITKKPASELNSFVQSLPAGQKVAQVILGKLTEAAR